MIRKFAVSMVCFFLATSCVYADTLQFVFITSPQTILPNTISGAITIQSQNELRAPESILETFDLMFVSSSPTGKFLSSTGNVVSKTMAKGTANRTFYYSDTTLGTWTLTITATGRISKKKFSIVQEIKVVSVLPPKSTPPVKSISLISTSTQELKYVSKNTKKIGTEKRSQPALLIASSSEHYPYQYSSTTNSALVYQGARRIGVFDSLLDWPGKLWSWLKSIL